ncbi:hypothetical protein ABIE38_002539 [Dietzia sp. 2505]
MSQDNDQTTTTSPAAAEQTINPWDLPIEQRPALFDPCVEIPIEAVEQGVGGPVEPSEQLHNHRPGELLSCGWKNDEVLFGALTSWKSLDDYMADSTYVLEKNVVENRSGFRVLSTTDTESHVCRQLFITPSGVIFVSLDLIGGLSSFKGEYFSDSCDILDRVLEPILPRIPGGDS